ncbi:hypothetical protein Tco_0977574 [Tanacetum coccineum]|uniref:Uncharacterized protein n=1 Tax=Tanacetum coccineum TaxID=301880 RepID=A0ABQ5ELK7_9ASTR
MLQMGNTSLSSGNCCYMKILPRVDQYPSFLKSQLHMSYAYPPMFSWYAHSDHRYVDDRIDPSTPCLATISLMYNLANISIL